MFRQFYGKIDEMNVNFTFKRLLRPAKESFFLFGPRATGKTTWLKEQVHADYYINLLHAKEFLRFSNHPEELSEIVRANAKWKCVVIDEIQKVPALLDEIHSIIFETKNRIQFILTGSSARKLKNENVNLLAGRALVQKFYPLVAKELGSAFDLDLALRFGLLPRVWSYEGDKDKVNYLYSYVETYLREEVQHEALTRNLPAYSKFLEHMALRNGQVINISNLSREIGLARTTLKGYLDILEDTLLGFSLFPIHLKARVKEVVTPKFYFFDTGVVNALTRNLQEEKLNNIGTALETFVLHELRAFSDYHQKHFQFYYWGTPSDNEVDFIVSSGTKNIGIEVKNSKNWKKEYGMGLRALLDSKKITKGYGIYRGDEIILKDDILVIPATLFPHWLMENQNVLF